MALVYPSVLKMILSRILLSQDQSEDDNVEDWPEQWIAIAREAILGVTGTTSSWRTEGFESVSQWIDQAVRTLSAIKIVLL